MRRIVTVALVGLSLGIGPGRAGAAEVTEPAAPQPRGDSKTPGAVPDVPAKIGETVESEATLRARARRHYLEGRRLFEKRRYREAIAALQQAATLWPRREISFNIALCHFELGERLEAAQHLRQSLEGTSQEERRSLPRALRALLARVGVVVVRVARDDAEIWIDGRQRGKKLVVHVVWPGDVAAEVRIQGRVVAQKLLQVAAGVEMQWELGPLGQQTVESSQGVGHPGQAPPVSPPPSRARLPWFWLVGAGGAAVVAAGLAIGLGVRTRSLHEEYLKNPSWSLRDEGRWTQAATNVFWGLAGAAAVSAAVLAVFTRYRPERSERSTWTPLLLPGGMGFAAQF